MRPEHYLNAMLSLFLAASLSYIVFAEHIKEGLVVKLGLIFMISGLTATSILTLVPRDEYDWSYWQGLWNAGLMTRLGLAIIVLGYWLRRYSRGHPCLRSTDWQTFN